MSKGNPTPDPTAYPATRSREGRPGGSFVPSGINYQRGQIPPSLCRHVDACGGAQGEVLMCDRGQREGARLRLLSGRNQDGNLSPWDTSSYGTFSTIVASGRR